MIDMERPNFPFDVIWSSSPEPYRVDASTGVIVIKRTIGYREDDLVPVVETLIVIPPPITTENKKKAERIVACVNACEGLEDPEQVLTEANSILAAFDSRDPVSAAQFIASVYTERDLLKHELARFKALLVRYRAAFMSGIKTETKTYWDQIEAMLPNELKSLEGGEHG